MAMMAQQQLRRRINGNGNGGAAMGVAVVVAAQRWRRSNGGGGAAMVVDTIELYRTLFLYSKLISYVAFYLGPIQTGFLMTFRKSYGGTGIVIPVKKALQDGAEKTGIRRIPPGITNLDLAWSTVGVSQYPTTVLCPDAKAGVGMSTCGYLA